MKLISHCCGKPTYEGTLYEYPLGGNTWRQAYKVTRCTECGDECEEVHGCDWCGEEGSSDELVPVGLDRMHKHCKEEFEALNPEVKLA
jgi:hypothetical protein